MYIRTHCVMGKASTYTIESEKEEIPEICSISLYASDMPQRIRAKPISMAKRETFLKRTDQAWCYFFVVIHM